jgi:hypothetical protein
MRRQDSTGPTGNPELFICLRVNQRCAQTLRPGSLHLDAVKRLCGSYRDHGEASYGVVARRARVNPGVASFRTSGGGASRLGAPESSLCS